MKSIVLVNPPLPIQENYVLWKNAGPQVAPLNMISIAAVIRERGYKTSIIDAEALRLTINKTVNKVMECAPDYIGLTATTIFINAAVKIAEKIKQRNPKPKIIIGSNHLTALPEDTMLSYPAFDVGVIGEGEATIVELLEAFENDKDLSKIDDLVYKENGEILFTKKRELIRDLDADAFLSFELEILPFLLKKAKTKDVIIASRYVKNPEVPFYRWVASKVYDLINKNLFGIDIRDVGSGFVIFKNKAIKNINLVSDGFDIHIEIYSKLKRKNYQIEEIPVNYKHWKGGSFDVLKHGPKTL